MNYILIVGRLEKELFAEKPEDRERLVYRGHYDSINELAIPSVEIAHQIAKLCNVTTYCIAEATDSWNKEPVFCTQDILDYDKKVKQEREEHNKSQSALADFINSQPLEISPAQFVYSSCRVVFIRSQAEYNPKRSGKVLWDFNARVRRLDTADESIRIRDEDGEGLSFDHYKSRGTHNRLHKRFLKDWGWRFGDNPDFKKLWEDLPAIEREYWATYHQIQGKGGSTE